MDTLAQDLRFALRSLRSTPGSTTVVVLTLALGIGANTAIFSLVDEMLLRPLPIVEPERVVAVFTSDYSSGAFGSSSLPDFRDFRDQSSSLAGLAAYDQGREVDLRTADDTTRAAAALVSGEYFDVVGLSAHVGRVFSAADTEPGAPPTVVLGHGLWRDRFGGRADVLGETINVNGIPLAVVGVAPAGFRGMVLGREPEVWLPLGRADVVYPEFGAQLLEARGARWLGMVGRLADGVTVGEAEAEMNAIMARLAEEYPENLGTLQQPDRPRPMAVLPAADATLGGGRRSAAEERAALLLGIVGLVLATACANVGNLVLAKGRRRRTELAVRLSLGAHRGRLVRQLMTESLVLSLLGGLAGLFVAGALARLLVPLGLTAAISRYAVVEELAIDVRVLLFALAASLATGLLCGLVPALRASRPDLVPALKSGSTRFENGGGRAHGRDLLVVAQIAGSIVLLIGAGLFVRSLERAQAVDLGFDPEGVLLVDLDPASQGLDRDRQRNFYAEVRRRVESLPGVEAAALARVVPVASGGSRSTVRVEGYTPAEGEDMELNFNSVSPGYFRALGIPILRGRGFDDGDSAAAPQVAVVNQAFVDHFWPGLDPIGKRIFGAAEDSPPIEVVGLTGTGKYRSVREDPRPYVYYPLAQRTRDAAVLAARTGTAPMELLAPVRETVRSLQPGMPASDARTLVDHQGIALAQERNIAILTSILGALALLIAAVGVYGVMSNAVSQRVREIGIRSALGARVSDIAGMILFQAARLSLVGAAIGVGVAWLNRGFVADLLFEVSPSDPLTFAGVAALLVSVAVAASALPAWRASRVDPLIAVRDE